MSRDVRRILCKRWNGALQADVPEGRRFAESAKIVAAAGIQPVFFKNGHDLFHPVEIRQAGTGQQALDGRQDFDGILFRRPSDGFAGQAVVFPASGPPHSPFPDKAILSQKPPNLHLHKQKNVRVLLSILSQSMSILAYSKVVCNIF